MTRKFSITVAAIVLLVGLARAVDLPHPTRPIVAMTS